MAPGMEICVSACYNNIIFTSSHKVMLFCRRETIEKTSMFVLVSALFFALAACSGAKEEPIPGTYEAVSLYDAPAYQLNENGSYDHGEQKGTYT